MGSQSASALLIAILGFSIFSISFSAVAQTEVPLEELRTNYKTERAAISRPLEVLQGQYYKQLTKLRDEKQAAGDLEKVVAINAEIRILAGKVPEHNAPDFDALAKVRAIYQEANRQRKIEVKGKLIPFLQSYSKLLESHKIALTKASKIEEATSVNEEMKILAIESGQLKKSVAQLRSGTELDSSKVIELPAELQKSLAFYYQFDTEPKDSLVTSSTREEFNSLLEGAVWTDQGKHGGAIRFDGDEDRIRLGKALPDSDELTVSAWVYYSAPIESNGAIFSDFDGKSGNDLMFGLIGGKKVFVRADKIKGNKLNDVIEIDKSIGGEWHHLVWTMGSSRSTVYIDGKRSGSVSESGSNNGSHNGYIGYGNDGKGWVNFQGVLDEVAVWTTDLSASDVERLYLLTK